MVRHPLADDDDSADLAPLDPAVVSALEDQAARYEDDGCSPDCPTCGAYTADDLDEYPGGGD